jgi:hypothetical protein
MYRLQSDKYILYYSLKSNPEEVEFKNIPNTEGLICLYFLKGKKVQQIKLKVKRFKV